MPGKSSSPAVSVIVPNFNHGSFLHQRIQSILNQTYQDFELILIDDRSTDESREILETYRNHQKTAHLVFNENNSGSPFLQWEKGMQLAKGRYIWIAESDDWANPQFLEKLVPLLDSNPSATLVCAGSEFVNETGEIIQDRSLYRKSFKRQGVDELLNYMAFRNSIHNASAVVFRRSAMPAINAFDWMKYCGDWLFWGSIMKKGDFIFLNEKLNFFRRHPNNISFAAEKNNLWLFEGIHICRIVFSVGKLSADTQKKILSHWLNNLCRKGRKDPFLAKNITKYIASLSVLFKCNFLLCVLLIIKMIFTHSFRKFFPR